MDMRKQVKAFGLQGETQRHRFTVARSAAVGVAYGGQYAYCLLSE